MVKNTLDNEVQLNAQKNNLSEPMRALLSQSTTIDPQSSTTQASSLSSLPTKIAIAFSPTCFIVIHILETTLPLPLTTPSGFSKSSCYWIKETFDNSVICVTTRILHREPKTSLPSLVNNEYRPSSVLCNAQQTNWSTCIR
ncbi:unnamed protein product [Lepeophtheirus salmonis]|uniref:(salmon louse) hypothetical protein n=1 Tax=Lepeophtheirus salmonis TaxID=72036 RepID=A0A7R8D3Z9_LEPSM|nr:unnamed protein product [Lepeophtheirus salmonis]CAF3016707.1 unnamed protein product [Lepeophtheirus salmonis]